MDEREPGNMPYYEQSEEIGQLAEAMAAFQGKVRNPPKTKLVKVWSKRTNREYTFRYAPLDAILDTVRPTLSEYGLSVWQAPVPASRGIGIITQVSHSSGQWKRSLYIMEGAKDGPKDQGSLISYALRYALSPALGICGEEDDDAGRAEGDETQVLQDKGRPDQDLASPSEVDALRDQLRRDFPTTDKMKKAGEILKRNGVNLRNGGPVTRLAYTKVREGIKLLLSEMEEENLPSE